MKRNSHITKERKSGKCQGIKQNKCCETARTKIDKMLKKRMIGEL